MTPPRAGSEPAWPPWMVARLSAMLFAGRSGSRPLSQRIDALHLNGTNALGIWKKWGRDDLLRLTARTAPTVGSPRSGPSLALAPRPSACYLLMRANAESPADSSGAIEHDHLGHYWLRGLDLNQRPSGYEPDELPDCSTPRYQVQPCGPGGSGGWDPMAWPSQPRASEFMTSEA